jgi:maltose alpha-D-glucosyltransferase / alpha-amylase
MNHIAEDPLPARIQSWLPGALPDYLRVQRWFGGKAHTIRSVAVPEVIPIYFKHSSVYLLLAAVQYELAPAQLYAIPLTSVSPDEGVTAGSGEPAGGGMVLEQEDQHPRCLLRDALYDRNFSEWLVESIRRRDTLRGIKGEIVGVPARALGALWSRGEAALEPFVMKGEQSNTSLRYGETFILKFYRRIEEGVNLDQEIGSFLTEKAHFKYTPPLAGAIQYEETNRPSATLAVLQGYVRNLGDAWRFTLDALDAFLEHVDGRPATHAEDARRSGHLRRWAYRSLDERVSGLLGPYLSRVQLLGRRTGELHIALASEATDPAFMAEGFSAEYRQRVADGMADLADNTLTLLQEGLEMLRPGPRQKAEKVLSGRRRVFSKLAEISELKTLGMRTRIHGDYHLGQVLVTDDDFAIIDFEGEPERPLADRRLKRSPLRDVAGMLRSFHYAASSVRIHRGIRTDSAFNEAHAAAYWLREWTEWVSAAFLQAYLSQVAHGHFLPDESQDLFALLEVFLLEKAIYELAYELKNRPDWVEIPLDGIVDSI